METNSEKTMRRTSGMQGNPNDVGVGVAEIKSLLGELDEFVSKLKVFEATLAERADGNQENVFTKDSNSSLV